MKKCECGSFRDAGSRWRVLERFHDNQCQVKCLQCGRKWISNRQYIRRLDDHSEKSRSGMTDSQILHRIKSGTLVVDSLGRFVESRLNGVSRRLAIWTRRRNGSEYRFLSICHGGLKKKISVHRLVWMSFFGRIVPDDRDVDHIKGRGIEFPDRIENLRLLPVSVNRSRKLERSS